MSDSTEPMIDTTELVGAIFPCEDLRNSVFGEGSLKRSLNSRSKFVLRSKSLFYITNAYFYSLYRKWREKSPEISVINDIFEHLDGRFVPNSTMRVLNVMDELYSKYSINNNIVSHILTNCQINLSTRRTREDWGLNDILHLPIQLGLEDKTDDAYITKFTLEIDRIERNARYLPPESVGDKGFNDLLRHFRFFKRIWLEAEKDGNVIFKIMDDDLETKVKEKVDSHHTLIMRDGILYYLTNMQHRNNLSGDTSLLAIYSSIYDGTNISIDIGADVKEPIFEYEGSEFFLEVTGKQFPEEGYCPELFYRGLNSGSYKYINRLSMALVDSIYGSPEGLITLVGLIRKHKGDLNINDLDRELYNLISQTETADITTSIKKKSSLDFSINTITWRSSKMWDDIVSRLLIIESPREILSAFIEKVPDVFDKLLVQIEYRFSNAIDTDRIRREKDEEMKTAEKELIVLNFGRMSIDEEHIRKWVNKTESMVAAKLIVKNLAEVATIKNDDETSNDRPKESVGGSVYPSALLVQDFIGRLTSGETMDLDYVLKRTDNILRNSLQMTICTFWSQIRCLDPWSEYEIRAYSGNLPSEEVKDLKAKIEREFVDEFRKRCGELKSHSSEELISELVKICNSCYDEGSSSIKNQGTEYYIMIGRASPVDLRSIGQIYSLNSEGVPHILFDKNLHKLSTVLDRCLSEAKDARNLVKLHIEKANEMLQLLGGCYGQFDSFNDLTQRAAYPFLGTYVDRRLNMDDHSIHNFAIINNMGKETRVHILSEFTYKINEKYYIMPNLQRTDREWWIQPLMIECEKINQIIKEYLSEDPDISEE